MTQQEYKNGDIHLLIHKRPACRIEFEVEVSPAIVKQAHKQAVRQISKEVTLPGFRKGKAPEDFVVKNYPQQVDKQWQETIANLSFQESAKLAHIPLLNQDSRVTFKMQKHSLEEGAKLTLTFETDPEVPSIDVSKIDLQPVKKPEVNDEKVSETIRQVQLFFATWKNIDDRPVQEGDFVLLDVEDLETDPPTSVFSNTRFEVTEKSMAQWMRDLVLGQATGATLEGVSVPDESASEEDKEALKPKKVRLHLKAIEQPTVPPVDEAFAKQLGVSTTDEMRQNIEKLLTSQAEAHVREKMREQINDYLLNNYLFDLPTTLIEKETRFRMQQLLQDPQFQKYWESLSQDDRRKTIESIAEQSKKAVCMFYICRKILTDAKLNVSPQDIPAYPTTPLELLLSPQPHSLHPHGTNEIKQAETYSRLLLEKAQDFLISHAQIK
ncbi:MAG TPA: trigger factor [Rhabdochlamydiaceae bacterium]